ncbi:MAG: SUMF1/EgtB/PvdO family nonheme iron enzyme [Alphaproteobacteria bacterium]|nr:SUMF1/EgtB/PvdO family nonheme iron enzyme [Alphaproteobacteria bacterium]
MDLAELVRRHGLSPAAAADLAVLLGVGTAPGATLSFDDLDEPAPTAPPEAERYEDLGPIGQGGMGEVRRVRDRVLDRVLAMKFVHADLLGKPAAVERFLREARATARLQHPNIVPVHDLGTLPDGRVWFTMKEVRGQTLTDVIGTWPLRRLIDVFHAVCRAVAFAHERGVVHRDLKPDNLMVGDHGDVTVLDWGLAKFVDVGESDLDTDEIVDTGPRDSATRVGQVAGTPAYMPPEQARGQVDAIDARSDVYALGAVLYEILSGRPPYLGAASEVVRQVRAGPPPPVGPAAPATSFGFGRTLDEAAGGPALPEELVDACERAMARDPADRFQDAAALADVVQAWLEGANARDRALQVTRDALAGVARAQGLEAEAAALDQRAAALLEGVRPWEPEARKVAAWALADEAERVRTQARIAQVGVDEGLHGALRVDPTLPEAHVALVERHRARFDDAEREGRAGDASVARALLETHAAALPDGHPTRAATASWLRGTGALTLTTDPPGAEVLLYRYEEVDRRLVERFERSLGPTPLREAQLAMGSYVCILVHPDREPVRYPVEITRCAHWDGVPPGASDPAPVWLPPRGWLAEDEVYVPAGWFRAGGGTGGFPSARLWCGPRVFQRFVVTNARYVAFLDDLVAQGRADEAHRHAPTDPNGAPIYAFEDGRFHIGADPQGDAWDPEWPVLAVSWFDARAWLAWHAERTGRPWRLPGELEWEKAARGVDGRRFPWGSHFDATRCCMTASHRGQRSPSVVDDYPLDASPYGVRGVVGNTQQWCAETFSPTLEHPDDVVHEPQVLDPDAPRALRAIRGGTWDSAELLLGVANRFRIGAEARRSHLGFRGAYSVS